MFRNMILPQSTPAMPPRIPPPSHRHGAPSGPWPFIDIDDEVDGSTRISELPVVAAGPCRHTKRSFQGICWCKYPQSLFPNWTPQQQKKSRITKILERLGESSLHYLDIMQDGSFVNAGVREISVGAQDLHWAAIQHRRPPGVRTRTIFVENLTGPVLQMLGTCYNIEPFFFSSSIRWIPSRYQSNVVPDRGDHITITLVFIRPISNPTTVPPSPTSTYAASIATKNAAPDLIIDTQSPLLLRSSDILLCTELMALHIVRSPDSSTIISYHPTAAHRATSAASMHARMHSTGRSVYWSNIFKEEKDPTFTVLSLLWYAIYAWDEAFEMLYAHICFLESKVLAKKKIVDFTQELHLIRAHLLRYDSLLCDFQRTVLFLQHTPLPYLQNSEMYTEEERLQSEETMKRETENLLSEIRRLENTKEKYDWRLKNIMDLRFSMVNIQYSKKMQQLAKATRKDSAAMKQLSYLTMVFFPASFAASILGMNVTALNPCCGNATLGHYVALVVPLTALTIWIIVALEIDIKQIRTSRRNPIRIIISGVTTIGQNPRGSEKDIATEGQDKLEVGSEDESEVKYSFDHKIRGALEGPRMEVEMIRGSDIWTRLCWPVILLASALDKRQKTKKAPRTERVGSTNTKTKLV